MKEYKEREHYNNVISIKLVIPGSCNANCSFCYNKHGSGANFSGNKEEFLNNFTENLGFLLGQMHDENRVSLDITGNEPTLDIEFFKKVMDKLKWFKLNNTEKEIERVTLTTNGVHLLEVIPYLKDVVDFVNISLHSMYECDREKTMGFLLPNWKVRVIVAELERIYIPCSMSIVINDENEDIADEYSKELGSLFDTLRWCKKYGFISLRLRCDVFWNNTEQFDKYMHEAIRDDRFEYRNYEKTPDSEWCRLKHTMTGVRLFFLHGVENTSEHTKGIEYVIHDDGKCYCDFNKKVPIGEYEYEIGKIYDEVI